MFASYKMPLTETIRSAWVRQDLPHQLAIETGLDSGLPEVYDRAIYARKTTGVFEHIFSSYQGSGKSVFDAA